MTAQRCYEVSWDTAAEVVRVDWLPGAICDLDVARAVEDEIRELGQGPVRARVDLRPVDSIDRPARELFMGSPLYSAVALVVGSASTRMLANFFLGLKRSAIPVKIFSDEADAVAWLQAQT